MNYWIFKCNPERYHLDERLKDPMAETTWLVTRYKNEIEPGDIAFLWRTGIERGIRAVMQIDTAPADMAELPSEQPYWDKPDTEVRCRVCGRLTKRNIYLSHKVLKAIPALANLSLFHGFQQATNFRVTPEEGAMLADLIGGL